MPIGSFFIHLNPDEEKKEKIKKEKQNKENAHEKVEKQERSKKQKDPEKQEKPEEKHRGPAGDASPGSQAQMPRGRRNEVGCRMPVLLIGRDQRLILDFLCSMNINMNDIAGAAGLAFYTEDHETMFLIIETKKQLEEIFYAQGGETDRKEMEEETEPRKYFFDISFAGKQSRCVELEFTCVTPEALRGGNLSPAGFDTVWVLAEEPCMEQGGADGDLAAWLASWRNRTRSGEAAEYGGNGKQKGKNAAAQSVFFLACQFEHLERFRVRQDEIGLSMKTKRHVSENIKNAYGYAAEDTGWKIMPVQIYGGLEYGGTDENGRLRLEMSRNGFYRRYVPVGCHMPVAYTLSEHMRRGDAEFLSGDEGNLLWTRLQNTFRPFCENDALQAESMEMGPVERGADSENNI